MVTRRGGGYLQNIPGVPIKPMIPSKPDAEDLNAKEDYFRKLAKSKQIAFLQCTACQKPTRTVKGVDSVTCPRCVLILSHSVSAKELTEDQEREANKIAWRKRRAERRKG